MIAINQPDGGLCLWKVGMRVEQRHQTTHTPGWNQYSLDGWMDVVKTDKRLFNRHTHTHTHSQEGWERAGVISRPPIT